MTLQDFVVLLLRRWKAVVAFIVLGAVAGLFYESSQPAVVATDGRLLIGPSLEGDLNVIESTGSLSRGTLQQTLAELVTGSEVTTTARAAVDNMSDAYSVESIVIPETNVVKISVLGTDGDAAIALASEVMTQGEVVFERLYPVYDVAVLDQPDRAIQTSPNPELGVALGAVSGAAVAAIAVVASQTLTRSRRQIDREDAEDSSDDSATRPGPIGWWRETATRINPDQDDPPTHAGDVPDDASMMMQPQDQDHGHHPDDGRDDLHAPAHVADADGPHDQDWDPNDPYEWLEYEDDPFQQDSRRADPFHEVTGTRPRPTEAPKHRAPVSGHEPVAAPVAEQNQGARELLPERSPEAAAEQPSPDRAPAPEPVVHSDTPEPPHEDADDDPAASHDEPDVTEVDDPAAEGTRFTPDWRRAWDSPGPER